MRVSSLAEEREELLARMDASAQPIIQQMDKVCGLKYVCSYCMFEVQECVEMQLFTKFEARSMHYMTYL